MTLRQLRQSHSAFLASGLILLAALLLSGCRLPQYPEEDDRPALLSETRIAYLDERDLWVMRADGTEVTLIVEELGSAPCEPYVVSPDGFWVAYQRLEENEVWIAATDGSTRQKILDTAVESIGWLPDSTGLVFASIGQVYLLPSAEGARPEVIAIGGRRFLAPTWSPDSKNIAFLESLSGEVFNVIVMQPETKRWNTLGTTAAGNTRETICQDRILWSPDSTRFLINYGDPVFIYYLVGGTPLPLKSKSPAQEFAWAPDGRSLAFRDEDGNLWLVKADGTEQRKLLEGTITDMAWSPAGDEIAVIRVENASTSIALANVTTGRVIPVTGEDFYKESELSYLPDGSGLVFARTTLTGEKGGIWAIDLESATLTRLSERGDTLTIFTLH